MSVINLYDADMAKYIITPFNLDIMKYSKYYKRKRDIVVLTNQINLDKYSKLIYRKDYYDGTFESELLRNEKVEYGGRAFSQDKYIPLPDEIENCKPDTYIYDNLENWFSTTKYNNQLFNTMIRAQHIRLSLDGTTIWNNWKCQLNPNQSNRIYIFHDYDIGKIENSFEVINELLINAPTNDTTFIGTKFPINVYSTDELLTWAQFRPMQNFYSIQYNGIMEDECLYMLITNNNKTSVPSQMMYNITYNISEDEFLSRLQQIYRQFVFLRMNRIYPVLIYEPTIFSNQLWSRLLDLFRHYLIQGATMSLKNFRRIVPYDSLYSFARSFSPVETYKFHFQQIENQLHTKEEAKQIFQFVREENYELFKDFYECHQVKLIGGKFESC